MIALLFTLSALADDGIVHLPPGSTVDPAGTPPVFTVDRESWLLPGSHYDKALIQSRRLEICEPALERCTTLASSMFESTAGALAACSVQMQADDGLTLDLQERFMASEARAAAAEQRLSDVRHQRNVAWALAGGLVLGGAAIAAVSL